MRPFVFINSAMSADGKISTIEKKQVKISGLEDFKRVDELKATVDAVMVGVETVIADDPRLTIKSDDLKSMRLNQALPENPLRVVVDSNARTPTNARVVDSHTIIAASKSAPRDKLDELARKAHIMVVGERKVDLKELLSKLNRRGVKRLMVEGGGTLNFSLLSLGLVDEVYTYISNIVIGGANAPTLADGEGFINDFVKLELLDVNKLGHGILIKWKVVQATDR
ncbi:MAG TPA: 2,5-diamino-6-(ribosylamino)-4(3H)-pyrimidinone 5'-phosphate reductase [Candidatus Acidoferrales bacterium]|nr:2,5-diamino-6-(ribosylamino)-4(3H)-pyrimidinone 5'-phosphate reductase [Candidatus Acidoferrales bacterium]